jgi:hypothetical protein
VASESVIGLPDGTARAALRISGDYMLDWIAALRTPFGGDFDLALAFAAVLHGNIRDFSSDAELSGQASEAWPPGQGAPRLPISARSLGRSIFLPHETTRRHAQALIEGGWVERTARGLTVPPGVVSGPRLRTVGLVLYAQLRATLTALAALSSPAPAFRLAPDRAPLSLVLTGEYLLRWTELHIGPSRRLNANMLVYWTILQGNVRHLNHDPELQRLYADTLPPDEIRRPVSVQDVTDSLGIAYETVRQMTLAMQEVGLLARVRGGLIAPREALERESSLTGFRTDLANLRRMLSQLSEFGVLLPG